MAPVDSITTNALVCDALTHNNGLDKEDAFYSSKKDNKLLDSEKRVKMDMLYDLENAKLNDLEMLEKLYDLEKKEKLNGLEKVDKMDGIQFIDADTIEDENDLDDSIIHMAENSHKEQYSK